MVLNSSPNRLLSSLPANVFSAITRHLEIVDLKLGDVLAESGRPVQRVYFPYSGAISLVVEIDRRATIETAMVGRDGAMNAVSALGRRISLNKGIVRLAGRAGIVEVGQLSRLTDEFKPLRALLLEHEQVLFAQAQQSAACNASHTVEARMCRWLLHLHDFAGSDDVILTQEVLAQMLACGEQAFQFRPICSKRQAYSNIVAGTYTF